MSQFGVDGQSVHFETECHSSKLSQQMVCWVTLSLGRNVTWSVRGWTDCQGTVLVLPAWYVEKAICTECRVTIPQYTVLLSLCLVTHWFSPHHHLHLQLSVHSFSYPQKKSKLKHSFGCHNVNFQSRPLGFLELFPNSPLSFFLATSHEAQPPTWPLREPSDPSGLEPDGPPWVSLALNAFGRLFLRSSLTPDCSENHLIWVDAIGTVPLGLQYNPPWVSL
jgi:hypothetical protein